MHIRILFNAAVLVENNTKVINKENFEFYMMASQCCETELIWLRVKEQEVTPLIKVISDQICIFDDQVQVDEYLEKNRKTADWILYFNNKKYCRYENVICMPIDFYGDLMQFENLSFTEHAKNKLLYNELSKYYMDSIANDTEAEVKFIENVFKKYTPGKIEKILDCCCGIGRHDYRLALDGYLVTGIDISKTQIENANKVHSHDNIRYFVNDIRNFDLQEKSYDMAICMWTTYNYLSLDEDFMKFIKNVHSHLCENGILMLDSKNIPSLEKRRVYTRHRSTNDVDISLFVSKRIINNIQNSLYFYFIKDSGNKNFYLDEEFVRFYYLNEIIEMTKQYFEIVACYGSFNGEDYIEDESERFIIVLRKRSGI